IAFAVRQRAAARGSGETWALDLLEKGEHSCDGLRGPFCRGPRRQTAAPISRRQGNAQGHRVLIDDRDEACLVLCWAEGTHDKAPAEERMRRIGDLDRFGLRVLEVGIKEWLLSTLWIMGICELFSDFGCRTVCCCA